MKKAFFQVIKSFGFYATPEEKLNEYTVMKTLKHHTLKYQRCSVGKQNKQLKGILYSEYIYLMEIYISLCQLI